MTEHQYGGEGRPPGGFGVPPMPISPPPMPTSPPPMPSTPPPAPADPVRAAAVALLNLTGLGLGYLLLRRRLLFATCVLLTAALLAVALPADANGVPTPAVAVYLILLLAAAVHGAATGLRRYLAWPPAAPIALAMGVVLLALPVSGTLVYGAAHDEAVQRMLLSRLADADAQVASVKNASFTTAAPTFRKALATYRDLADHHAGTRAAGRVPASLATYYDTVATPYSRKQYCEAIAPLTYLRTLPATVGAKKLGALAGWPDDRLATSLYSCGTTQFANGTGSGGDPDGGYLGRLLTDFPHSAQAGQVAPFVTGLVAASAHDLTGSDPCAARDDLRDLRTRTGALPGDKAGVTDALDKAADQAARDIETGTYDCGVAQYKKGSFGDALDTMNAFVKDYPHDGHNAYAKKVAIAAQIASDDSAAGKHLPSASSSGGGISVTFSNASPDRVKILYTGAVTGSVTLSACGSCKTYDDAAQASGVCRSGRSFPHHTLYLPAGTMYFMQDAENDPNTLDSHTRRSTLSFGYEYTECAYVVHEDGFDS